MGTLGTPSTKPVKSRLLAFPGIGYKSINSGNIYKNSGYKLKKGVFDISDIAKNIPTQTEIRQIFNDTYNVFYKKWKDISSAEQWPLLMQDVYNIYVKYPYRLCRDILLNLVECIEEEFLNKQGGNKSG